MGTSVEAQAAGIRVVLCQPTHPGNIGAAARAMKTMGLSQLTLVSPRIFPDEQAVARAAFASDLLDRARVCESLEDAVADCTLVVGFTARIRHEGPQLQDVADAAEAIARRSVAERVALVFGTERSGLTNDELARCHVYARIPTAPEASSLNLAAAVQVACYVVSRAAGRLEPTPAAPDEAPRAPRGELDVFIERLWTTALRLGTFNASDPRFVKMRERLRRLLARAAPSPEELRAAFGMVSWLERYLAARED